MTVAELIEELQKLPFDAEVYVHDDMHEVRAEAVTLEQYEHSAEPYEYVLIV